MLLDTTESTAELGWTTYPDTGVRFMLYFKISTFPDDFMNQMDHTLEYSEGIDCVHVKLTNDLFFCVCCFGWPLSVCTCCFNPAFPKGQEMGHIKPSLPQFLHPLMCVFSVSSTVISAVSVALGSAESLTY